MTPPHPSFWYFLAALVLTSPQSVTAQRPYAGIGIGPTLLLDDQPAWIKTTSHGALGVVGVEKGPLGLRLEGTDTFGWLWLDMDLTYRFGSHRLPVQPYALGGAGLRLAIFSSADPVGTAGLGLRSKLTGPFSMFGEGRIHHLLSRGSVYSYPSVPGTFQERTYLFVTFGISLGP